MGYTKYAWVGNRISDEDMADLYRMKLRTRRPITALVAEAVSNYILSHKQDNAGCGEPQNPFPR